MPRYATTGASLAGRASSPGPHPSRPALPQPPILSWMHYSENEAAMSNAVNQALHALLKEQGVDYRTVQHEPTTTSADSARARGEELKIGGKALVVKTADEFRLLVLSAACSLDSASVKRHFGVKKFRFADSAELERLTGLAPGAVPPFGRPILPLELFVDPSTLENERIAFNAGLLTESMVMSVSDYVRLAQPSVLSFASRPDG